MKSGRREERTNPTAAFILLCFLVWPGTQCDQAPYTPAPMLSSRDKLYYQTVSQSTLVLPSAAFVGNLVTAAGKVTNMHCHHLSQKSNAKKKNTKFATLAILWVSWLHYTYWEEGTERRNLHLLMHLNNRRDDMNSAPLSPWGEWLHSDSQPAQVQGTADCGLEGDRGGKESPHYPSKITIFPLHHLAGRRLFVCFCTKAKYDRQEPLGYAKGYYISEPPMHF